MTKIQSMISRALADSDLIQHESNRRPGAVSSLIEALEGAKDALCDGQTLAELAKRDDAFNTQFYVESAYEQIESALALIDRDDDLADQLAQIIGLLAELSEQRARDRAAQENRNAAYVLFKEYFDRLVRLDAQTVDNNLKYGYVGTEHGICGELSFNDNRGYIYVETSFSNTTFCITPTNGRRESFELEIREEADFLAAMAEMYALEV